jgi:cbb3-type cytochrome oxidase subunit 3
MQLYSALASAITVLSFLIFIGIATWAWSARRHDAFASAANAPFALPEDAVADAADDSGERAR